MPKIEYGFDLSRLPVQLTQEQQHELVNQMMETEAKQLLELEKKLPTMKQFDGDTSTTSNNDTN